MIIRKGVMFFEKEEGGEVEEEEVKRYVYETETICFYFSVIHGWVPAAHLSTSCNKLFFSLEVLIQSLTLSVPALVAQTCSNSTHAFHFLIKIFINEDIYKSLDKNSTFS